MNDINDLNIVNIEDTKSYLKGMFVEFFETLKKIDTKINIPDVEDIIFHNSGNVAISNIIVECEEGKVINYLTLEFDLMNQNYSAKLETYRATTFEETDDYYGASGEWLYEDIVREFAIHSHTIVEFFNNISVNENELYLEDLHENIISISNQLTDNMNRLFNDALPFN